MMDSELNRLFKERNRREMTQEEAEAAEMIKRIPAPLGLSEWETTDGEIYLKSVNAISYQVGLNRRNTL